MPDPVTGLIGGTAVVGSSVIQGVGARSAASKQAAAADAGIREQRRQFDAIQQLLAPYVEAGTTAIEGLQPFAQAGAPALEQQQALAGLRGQGEQQAAVQAIEQDPLFQGLVRQGEEAILQNAAATGGLRGGNTQAALAQFRPQMLSQEIADQFSRLGGLTALGQQTTQNIAGLGQASAAGTASAGMQTAGNIAQLQQQRGAAQAGGTLGQAQAFGNLLNLPLNIAMANYARGGTGLLGFGQG